jgi:3-hydroxyacyl-CoA dehydrogenase / enoyl-CoA hydratase / 3-hydroxybutyryl-CoA epimerase
MKTQLRHLRIDESVPGRITVWIDVAERSVNVLFDEVFDELVVVLDEMLCNESPPTLVFRSAKRKGFIVGADLRRILAIETDSEIQSFLLKGQSALERLEAYPGETVAVIQGPCLGGGLEFAMACRYRIASDTESTQLGMPEAKIGLMPGWGGTQRLVEIIGYANGLAMLLDGDAVGAQRSLELHLVDALFNDLSLDEDLSRFLGDDNRMRTSRLRPVQSENSPQLAFDRLFESSLQSAQFPLSQSAIFNAVSIGVTESRAAGFRTERISFFPLLTVAAVRETLHRFATRPKAQPES